MPGKHLTWFLLSSAALVCLFAARGLNAQAQTTPPITPPRLEFVYEETVTLGASIHPGATPFGERNIVPITGGTFTGPGLKGKILPGGWDWQLSTKSGCFYLQANYMIQTDDGVVINVDNRGRSAPRIRRIPNRSSRPRSSKLPSAATSG